MKEKYLTIIGISYYYGIKIFSIGKRIKHIKEPSNPYAIKVTMKETGTVGYIINSKFTGAIKK